MKNEVVRTRSFALLAKLAAVLTAIGGILLIHHPQSADRLVVVLAPGVAEERILAAIAEGKAPHLASLVATGLMAEVAATPPMSGLTFWRRLLANADSGQARLGVGGEQQPIWSGLGEHTAAVGVPDVLFPGLAGRRGPAQAAAGGAFVGSSAITAVAGDDLRAAHLPAPYDGFADKIRVTAAALAPGRWSDWMEAGEGGRERLQVLREDPDRFFLSPLYLTELLATTPASRVVVSDPFVASVEPDLRSALLLHLVAVDETRGVAVERLLESRADLRSLFYAFTVGVSAAELFGNEAPDAALGSRIVEALDQRVARASKAAGKGGLIAIVGGPGLDRDKAGAAWCLVSNGEGARVDRPQLDTAGLARVLRYLLGISLAAGEREHLPPSLLARYPRRTGAVAAPALRGGSPAARTSPWNADSLESLLRDSSS